MMRLRPGDALTGAGSLLLLLATFMDWYTPRARAEGLSAWAAFAVVDVILGLIVALGLALTLSQVTGRGPALPVALSVLTATIALGGALLVLYRILDQPGPNDLIEVRYGAWAGLAAVAAVAAGAWWALTDESPRPSDPPAPEIERRPAPPRA
jgi:hypothetical protein